jgi:hypothetical protein
MRIPSGTTDQYLCADCQIKKPADAFGVDRHQKQGRKYSCKECTNAKRRGRYHEENRRYHLKSKYGISPEQYESMLKNQSGLCAICRQVGEERSGGKRAKNSVRLYVDHDHVNRSVRGLLCHKCNAAIGLLYDDPSRIDRAADYVRGMPCA